MCIRDSHGALNAAKGPLTPDQIRAAFKKKVRPGVATLMRVLNAGLRDGSLRAVALGGGLLRYEPAARPLRQRFVCDACHASAPLHAPTAEDSPRVPAGARPTGDGDTLRARCVACVAPAS